MKVATWNVNGIRARQSQVQQWVERDRPDIVCLQAIKAGRSVPDSRLLDRIVRARAWVALLGFLLIVDMDRVEWKNLNRIYLTNASHANLGTLKVDALADEIGRIGLGTEVVRISKDINYRAQVDCINEVLSIL